jgi:hypothetical protein
MKQQLRQRIQDFARALGRDRWPPNAMDAGRDAAMLVAPVHEALMRLGAL